MTVLIARCPHITEYFKKSKVFGSHAHKFTEANNNEIGEPVPMPSPFVKPIKTLVNASEVLPELKGLELTWLRVDSLSRYGIYHSIIARFGNKHWVTKDSSGMITLRIYETPFF
ncbi:hypothetical protein EI165_19810 [Pseudoalteromonas nigrifaciens]|uniref:hypothetical protein n=1 Tax=Pseudoalteromonas nigrifaciens TaxID=28109 RepID=UPI0017880410|nr:hypothetical protein [Pseudoalteromonas nigrifaciens]MBE0422289.1 hypothetical protein [Pseudoalteromonas nigrifaciens]